MSGGEVFDPGLQPERTLLAWRRTCLAFAVASLVAARFTLDEFGILSIFLGLAGAGLAAGAYFAAAHGYRRAHDALHSRGEAGTSGVPVALGSAAALAVGAACAAFVFSGGL
ncbi:DUF202 domain-containing protein [Microbacterium excoecariae]|uniref:DUF202 domain-containing protein n=1 Tax=Microbacterium excoecariae TaxID=2715210 RepID=UPI00140BB508|nr:DUF202 domain-containing protein [Microbacterium excoecariae]NHI17666.1 DUF202 domain-containing protein [Microbacterium excoecariae]